MKQLNDIVGFNPYITLTHWCKNVDIVITFDEIKDFLSLFGYEYDETKYSKKNVSIKKEIY